MVKGIVAQTTGSFTERVRQTYSDAMMRSMSERHTLERMWYRNVLFYLGIQWITYNTANRQWGPRKTLKKWVPQPVTNKFATHANTIIQVLRAKPPTVTALPSSDAPDDVATAEITNAVLPSIYDEAGADEARWILAPWLTLTGNAFLHVCYDNSPAHGMAFVQNLQCTVCGTTVPPDQAPEDGSCPTCGPEQPTLMMPATDPAGEPMGEEFPRGKLRMEVFSPFEVFVDMEARSMNEVQELLVRRRYTADEVLARWGKKIEPNSKSGDSRGGSSQSLLRALAYAAGSDTAAWGQGTGNEKDIGVTVDFMWKRPCKDFPEGIEAVFANDELLNEDTVEQGISYRDKEGKPRWPWRHVTFDKVPGRFWAKTPMDDVAPLQEQRNRIESLVELIIRRSANPVWLAPNNIGFDDISGEPGQVLRYNYLQQGQKPERIPGDNVPTTVIAWLEKKDADMEEAAGTYEVLKGSAPSGITAGTALRLLLDRAVTRFTPVIEVMERQWADATLDLVETLRQFGADERVARLTGPGKTWEIRAFSGADFTGSVDMRAEAGSAVPKNTVGNQAAIQDLQSIGAIDMMNPETRYNVLEQYGQTSLMGTADDDLKHAQREEWDFFEKGEVPVLDPIIDNSVVHLMSHKRRALKSDFKELPPAMQAIWKLHLQEHQMVVMAQMAPAPAPGQEEGDGGDQGGPEPTSPQAGAQDPEPAQALP